MAANPNTIVVKAIIVAALIVKNGIPAESLFDGYIKMAEKVADAIGAV